MNGVDFLELGAVAVIFCFSIREFFKYLKDRKNVGNGATNELILMELQTMNNNHLHSMQEAVESGNRELIKTIHDDNMKIIELLGEIKGSTLRH